ncbi:MAG: cytidine deaminase [Clostridiales bacterium]|nr:cytidine deaminase [Clostridiales bacterium]
MDELSRVGEKNPMNINGTLPVVREDIKDIPQFAEKLLQIAKEAREFSYSPYSNYSVGAALLCGDGSIYTGCNVETIVFNGVCAERNACFKAISDGKRDFLAIAVAGGKHGTETGNCTPCGVCRQVLAEFARENDIIVIYEKSGEINAVPLSELLPYSFDMN